MPEHVAALDQGTTSTRCLIVDAAGHVVSAAQRDHAQLTPKPGWVEHDPREIAANARLVIAAAIADAGLRAPDILAMGITNQRETIVVWDRRTGEPFGNAIVWQDTRTERLCAALAAEHEDGRDRYRELTGLPLATYFSGPKIQWILENVEAARAAADNGDALAGTIDSWLTWTLSGGPDGGAHVTDPTNASRTLLMDLRSLDWSAELLDALHVPRAMLPAIRPSSDPTPLAHTNDGIPIHAILGDQQAALFGQACFNPGEAKNTYGTGCFLLMHTGTEPVHSRHGLIATVAYHRGGEEPRYALEGSIAIAGALVQWLRDQLGIIDSAEEVEERARAVEDSGGAVIVPAFSGLYAPHWRSDARGIIAGLTRYVNRDHLCRAALEATALQVRDVAEAMRRDASMDVAVLKVDGGMVVNDLLMQLQSDLLGTPVVRPKVNETTALGAAYAAGLAAGLWSDLDELRDKWRADKRWEPRMDEAQRQAMIERWQRALERSLGWVQDDGNGGAELQAVGDEAAGLQDDEDEAAGLQDDEDEAAGVRDEGDEGAG